MLENEVFEELMTVLPMVQDSRQDKMTLLRLLIAYLNCRVFLEKADDKHMEVLKLSGQDSVSQVTAGFLGSAPIETIGENSNDETISRSLHKGDLSMRLTSVEDELRAVVSNIQPLDFQETEDTESKLERYRDSLELGMREFLGFRVGSLQHNNFLIDSSKNAGSSSSKMQTTRPCTITANSELQNRKFQGTTANKSKKYEQDIDGNKKDLESLLENNFQLSINRDAKTKNDRLMSRGHDIGSMFKKNLWPELTYEGTLMLEATGGFLLILDKNLTIIFVSENVSEYLGLTQVQLIGQKIDNFIKDTDCEELRRHLNVDTFPRDSQAAVNSDEIKRTFFMDLKYSFSKKKSKHKVTGSYLFHWNVRMSLTLDPTADQIEVSGLVCLCRYIPMNSILFLHNDGNRIKCQLSLDFKMLYIEPNIEVLSGFTIEEMKTTDPFCFKHPNDVYVFHNQHKRALKESTADSGYYRMMNRHGDFVWVFSRMELVKGKRNKGPRLDLSCIVVSPQEAQTAMRRDEEEYKRFKGEGFGRAFYSRLGKDKQQEVKAVATLRELKGHTDLTYKTKWSALAQKSLELKHIFQNKELKSSSSVVKGSKNFARKRARISSDNHRSPLLAQMSEEKQDLMSGPHIGDSDTTFYAPDKSVPCVHWENSELAIDQRSGHRQSFSMSSVFSESPTSASTPGHEGEIAVEEWLQESLNTSSGIDGLETGQEVEPISHISPTITFDTLIEPQLTEVGMSEHVFSSSASNPNLEDTGVLGDTLILKNTEASISGKGNGSSLYSTFQIDHINSNSINESSLQLQQVFSNGGQMKASDNLKEADLFENTIPQFTADEVDQLFNVLNTPIASTNMLDEERDASNFNSSDLSTSNFRQETKSSSCESNISNITALKCNDCQSCGKPMSFLGQLLEDNDDSSMSPVS